jgi:hypothetical protein
MRLTHPPFAKSTFSESVFFASSALLRHLESWLLTSDRA